MIKKVFLHEKPTQFKELSATNRTVITAVGEHCSAAVHSIFWDTIKMVSNESDFSRRKIKETIETT